MFGKRNDEGWAGKGFGRSWKNGDGREGRGGGVGE